ncbi:MULTISPECIES: excinuclease ABC subunit UvrA [Lactococcus]|uniref:excinuclease ABC subunit UvrA n=1 Tax=Lactococcus TaxID=1357 RepID=UPI0022E25923|nr:excinuclease ABC subunit UvrA [Lactococcus petauri]
MPDTIRVIADKVNNLKNVSLEIPKKKITVFTGVSGSGKSSLVFDTLADESQRLLNETLPAFVRQFLPKYERPDVERIENLPASIVIDQKTLGGNARSTLATITDIAPVIRQLFAGGGSPQLGADHFSFNLLAGMCPECQGIGKKLELKMELFIDKERSLNNGAVLFKPYQKIIKMYVENGLFDGEKLLKDYTEEELDRLYHGKEVGKIKMGEYNLTYEGIVDKFNRGFLQKEGDLSAGAQKTLATYTHEALCPVCQGKRLNQETLAVRWFGHSFADLMSIELTELSDVLAPHEGTEHLKQQIDHLIDLGLGYLSLDRETTTLSGGESQRVKLVKHLNNALSDMLYIFDEPSVGLHPRDVARINSIFTKLRDKGNTVLIIEHDPDVIKIADWVIEVGPGAGVHGGEIMFEGSYEQLLQSDCLTGKYLSKMTTINKKPRHPVHFYQGEISNANNLKNEHLDIPQGLLTVLTGVAGSGKSTLVEHSLRSTYPEAIMVTQASLAANSRSNPATFIGIMDNIRKAFAKVNEVKPSLFSYNSEGACPACEGRGYIESNLAFMETVKQTCEVCQGKRYKMEALAFKYQGKDITEVLDLTIEEALDFFKSAPAIKKKIKAMNEVGLGYLTLGQPTSTLSGGERQRLKLANEFYQKGNLFILDEPSTGLHLSDISRLMKIMKHFVDQGNTLVVIEHQLDIIRQADWIIDIGPEGGSAGGQVIYAGPPAGLRNCSASLTAQYI